MLIPCSSLATADDDIRSIDFELSSSQWLETDSNLSLTNANYTLEAWIKTESMAARMAVMGVGGLTDGTGLYVETDGDISFEVGGGLYRFDGNAITLGTWHHVAAVRVGQVVEAYVDGTLTAQGVDMGRDRLLFDGPAHLATRDPTLPDFNGNLFDGKIYRARVSNYARYTMNFTPSKTYSVDGNTLSLIVAKGPQLVDLNGDTLTLTGTPVASTDIPT